MVKHTQRHIPRHIAFLREKKREKKCDNINVVRRPMLLGIAFLQSPIDNQCKLGVQWSVMVIGVLLSCGWPVSAQWPVRTCRDTHALASGISHTRRDFQRHIHRREGIKNANDRMRHWQVHELNSDLSRSIDQRGSKARAVSSISPIMSVRSAFPLECRKKAIKPTIKGLLTGARARQRLWK